MNSAEWRVTVVVDNQAGDGLTAEHGFSCWIESADLRVVFDTGQGPAFATNAARLGVALEQANAIVLSHGHYDHTGGVSAALRKANRARVYIHPLGFEAKYWRTDGGAPRVISMPEGVASDLLERNYELSCGTGSRTIGAGAHLTGEIPRRTAFEDPGREFFLDAAGAEPDGLKDDQALYLDTPRGTVVVLGCAHSGAVNTLEYVSELTGGRQIHAVVGGMHLLQASAERVDRTAEALIRLGVGVVAPCHCTGARAASLLRERLGERVVDCGAGARFEFNADETRCAWGGAKARAHSPVDKGD